jgi:hypothetical protein
MAIGQSRSHVAELWAASQQLSFRMASSLRLARLVSHLHAAPCAGDQGVLVEEAEVDEAVKAVNHGDVGGKKLKIALQSGQIEDLSTGADGYRLSDHLPGPLQDHDRDELLVELARSSADGTNAEQVKPCATHGLLLLAAGCAG